MQIVVHRVAAFAGCTLRVRKNVRSASTYYIVAMRVCVCARACFCLLLIWNQSDESVEILWIYVTAKPSNFLFLMLFC